MKCIFTLMAGAVLCLLPTGVSGQVLPFRFYTTRDGLLSNRVTGISQDPSGYLWVATFEGLSVFDGQTFRNFTSAEGLSTSVVWCVCASSTSPGTVWLGPDEGGLTRFRDGKFSTIHLNRSPDRDLISSIEEDPDGTLWCAAASSVEIVRGDSSRAAIVRKPSSGISNVVRLPDGSHWVAIDRTLYAFSPDGPMLESAELPIGTGASLVCIFADADRTLWISGSDGTIFHCRGTTVLGRRKMEGGQGLSSCLVDRRGFLWVGTGSGLLRVSSSRFTTDSIQQLRSGNGLPDDLASPLMLDHEGDIWGATWNHGLFKLAEQNTVFFPVSPGQMFCGLAVDTTSHGWALLDRSVLEIWSDAGGWHSVFHPLSGHAGLSGAQFLIRNGDTIAITFGAGSVGLYRITHHRSGGSDLQFSGWFGEGLRLPGAGRYPVAVDALGRTWYSLESEYAALVDFRSRSVVKLLRHPDDMPFSGIRAVAVDRQSNLWIGGFDNGLAMLPHGDWEHERLRLFTRNDGLPDEKIRALLADSAMNLWIGTRHGGLSIYRDGRFRTLTERNGLLSDAIRSIAQTSDGKIWVGTSLGVMSLNPQKPEEISVVDETRGHDCIHCEVDSRDRVWVMTIDGVFVYDYPSRSTSTTPPPVYISGVSVNGNAVGVRGKGEFSHDQNNVSIEYVGISLREEKAVRYRYMLEGIDRTWSRPTDLRQVTYAALIPGTYTFHVEAFNGEGVKSTSPASYTFTIDLPYWRRWWFIMLANAVVLGAIALGAVRRVRVLRKERQVQQEFSRQLLSSQEEERKRIAAELHDSIGQDLTLIKNHSVLALNDLPPGSSAVPHLREIDAISSETMQDVRRISHNLRPYQIDRLGITRALQALINGFGVSSGVTCAAELDPIDGVLGSNGEINVYRIVQEILTNIGRHARATSVEVQIRREEDSTISIVIADNGRGLPDAQEAPGGAGLGLESIAERVRILGGTHTISSAPGRGTKIQIRVPYDNNRSDNQRTHRG